MTVTFDIHGLREIEAVLDGLGEPRDLRRLGTAALKRGTKPVVDRAKALAPKDQGDLASAIKAGNPIRAYRNRTPESVSTFIGIDESVDPRLHIYARAQEEGLRHTPANPYMRPALEQEAESTINAVKDELWKGIERRARLLARRAGL